MSKFLHKKPSELAQLNISYSLLMELFEKCFKKWMWNLLIEFK